ncbi:MAG TPA: heme-binding protein, partial [Nitrososphaerales archaeon]|nr:heme-binding protein [Nitrososphaerales archaeon]
MSLTLAKAQDMIMKAERKADQLHVRVSIYVVDSSGAPVAFARMDGADIHTADVARAKAYTAVAYSKNTM